MRTPTALDLDDIQGDVVIGMQKDVENFIFFKITTLFRRPGCEKVAPAGQFERTVRGPVTCPP
jgi:hypothetical protein